MLTQTRGLVFFLVLLYGCSHSKSNSNGVQPLSIRELEIKSIRESREQPFFSFACGSRTIRVAHGITHIKEENEGWNRMYGWGPVVTVQEGKRTRVLDLRKDFPSFYVSHVFRDSRCKNIFLFFDYGIEGPAKEYQVWVGEEQGERWYAGAPLRRPPLGSFPPAALESFTLDEQGNGIAWLKLNAGFLEEKTRGANISRDADVYYRVTTSDSGRTWVHEAIPAFSSILSPEEERHHSP